MGEKPARLLVRVLCQTPGCKQRGRVQLVRLPVFEGTCVVAVPRLVCSNCAKDVVVTAPKWLASDG